MSSSAIPHGSSQPLTAATNSEHIKSLDRLIRGFQVSRMIRLAADLEIADHIPAHDRVPVSTLASSSGVAISPLLRLCRALAAFGIFDVAADNTIGHSPMSALLRSDSNSNLYLAARFWAAPGNWGAWSELDAALRTNIPPHEVAWKMSRFDYMRDHPEEAHVYNARMATASGNRQDAIADAYDFSNASLIIDVGGGNGALLRAILARYPQSHGFVFDRDNVVVAIPADALVSGRLKIEGGNFFDQVPTGGDFYLLSWILHDWPDGECLQILQNCRRVMPSTARLLIAERVLEHDPSRGDPMDYLSDIQMMVIGGQERTVPEFQKLLTSAGFGPVRVIPTASVVYIIETSPI